MSLSPLKVYEVDMPDGWYRLPGDLVGDERREGVLVRSDIEDPHRRYYYWMYVKNKIVFDVRGTSNPTREYRVPADVNRKMYINKLAKLWGINSYTELFVADDTLCDDFEWE